MQHPRYVLLAFLAAGVLMGLTLEAMSTSAFEQFQIADPRYFGVVNLTTLIAVLGGAGTFFGMLRHQRTLKFADEVVHELSKVTWPTREETMRATTTVIVTTAFTAALLGVYDLIWKRIADMFLLTAG